LVPLTVAPQLQEPTTVLLARNHPADHETLLELRAVQEELLLAMADDDVVTTRALLHQRAALLRRLRRRRVRRAQLLKQYQCPGHVPRAMRTRWLSNAHQVPSMTTFHSYWQNALAPATPLAHADSDFSDWLQLGQQYDWVPLYQLAQRLLQRLRAGKACAADDMYNEHLLYAIDIYSVYLPYLFQLALRAPRSRWPMALPKLALIPKPAAKHDSGPAPWRLLTIQPKLWQLRASRAWHYARPHLRNQYLPTTCGVQGQPGAVDLLLALHVALRRKQEYSEPVVVLQMDLVRAFDHAPRRGISAMLQRRGVPAPIQRVLLYTMEAVQSQLFHPLLPLRATIVPTIGVPQGRCDSSELFSAYLADCLRDTWHECARRNLGLRCGSVTIPWLQYVDDLTILAPSVEQAEKILVLLLEALERAGLRANPAKFALHANRFVPRPRHLHVEQTLLPLAPADHVFRFLGVGMQASGQIVSHERARRGAAMGMASKLGPVMRSLGRGSSAARAAMGSLESTALWASEVLPPTPALGQRWSGLQTRICARWLCPAPDPHEAPDLRWRRRTRTSARLLHALQIKGWGTQHARRYYRAAQRVAALPAALRAMHLDRCLWWQRTMQALGGGCGPCHAIGRPSRWESLIATFHEQRFHRNWLDDFASFGASGEDSFVAWLLSQSGN